MGVARRLAAPPGHTGLFHAAIRYPTRARAGDRARPAAGCGRPADGASDHGVSEALYLNDPDGNGLELYWDRPRDQWPTTGEDGSIAMYTAPLNLQSLLAEA